MNRKELNEYLESVREKLHQEKDLHPEIDSAFFDFATQDLFCLQKIILKELKMEEKT